MNKFNIQIPLLHGNWVDLVFFVLLAYFVLSNSGFIDNFLEMGGFVFSLFFSYKTYDFFGNLLAVNFSIPQGFANALGFFVSWFVAEIAMFLVIGLLLKSMLISLRRNKWNRLLGFIPAVFQALIMYLFFVSLLFALPVKGQIKQDLLNSRTGPFFVSLSQRFEKGIKNVFGKAIDESLNFLTVEPHSNESLDLGFKLKNSQLKPDQTSEQIMFGLVNRERTSRGIPALSWDSKLNILARSYGDVMFENGFFAHTSAVDGSTPAERADKAGISYMVIGENLAFAPDVYVAHQGLMNSPGHRANILSKDYHRVGIGVIDGGVYGKMFVQEFTN